MDIKKSLKDVVVLVAICVVFATVLALVNSITAPIIAEQLAGAANEAYEAVMPGSKGFEDVDLTQYTLPSTVVEAKKETSGMGYAVKLETKGYGSGMVIIVGIGADGVVLGATCVTSNETNGDEKTYGGNFTGKDLAGVQSVELIAGSTMTTQAYRAAVVDAINAATIFGGGSADIRTPEQILSDNLNSALGLTGAEFTKVFLTEVVSAEKLYKENNGAGYVALIDGKFVGINSDGVAVKVFDAETNEVTEGVDELKSAAASDVALMAASTLTQVTYDGTLSNSNTAITKIEKTATGNYVFTMDMKGHGMKGDEHSYPSGKASKIMLSISAEGKVIDSVTLENNESAKWGAPYINDGGWADGFLGKTEAEAGDIDFVAESTNTTRSYKMTVLFAFEVFTAIEGGAANE